LFHILNYLIFEQQEYMASCSDFLALDPIDYNTLECSICNKRLKNDSVDNKGSNRTNGFTHTDEIKLAYMSECCHCFHHQCVFNFMETRNIPKIYATLINCPLCETPSLVENMNIMVENTRPNAFPESCVPSDMIYQIVFNEIPYQELMKTHKKLFEFSKNYKNKFWYIIAKFKKVKYLANLFAENSDILSEIFYELHWSSRATFPIVEVIVKCELFEILDVILHYDTNSQISRMLLMFSKQYQKNIVTLHIEEFMKKKILPSA
jgi:hypothetical protein